MATDPCLARDAAARKHRGWGLRRGGRSVGVAVWIESKRSCSREGKEKARGRQLYKADTLSQSYSQAYNQWQEKKAAEAAAGGGTGAAGEGGSGGGGLAGGMSSLFAKRFYEGGFEDKMTRREAALILGVRYVWRVGWDWVGGEAGEGEALVEWAFLIMTFPPCFPFLQINRESANPQRIKEAHRRILMLNHPDTGGSTYLASKINEVRGSREGREGRKEASGKKGVC